MSANGIIGLINDVIDEAIFHGGDSSNGPYFSNASSLEAAVSILSSALECDYTWDGTDKRFIRLTNIKEED